MKRSLKVVIPLLLAVVMLLSALCVFMFSANAVGNTEATLTTYTVNFVAGKATGKDEVKSLSMTASETGSFSDMAAKLKSLEPTVATRYVLTLNSDVTVSEAFTVAGNSLAEVHIVLAGHTLTSEVDGPLMTANGTGATIRIFGEFNADGSYGKFVTTKENAALVEIAAGSSDYVDVNYLDANFGANAAGTAFFIANGGRLNIEHSTVTHGSGTEISVINAKDAKISYKYNYFDGGKNSLLVSSSASDVYIEGGEMIGKNIVVSDDKPSDIIVTGFACEVDTAFVQASADTKTYVLGSPMEIYTAIANGEATKENLIFYYGDGTMYIIGQDPSQYGIADSGSFAVSELVPGTWYIVPTTSSKAVVTTAVVGSVPTTELFDSAATALGATVGDLSTNTSSVEGNNVRIVTLLADHSGAIGSGFLGSEHSSLIVDLNGYNVTYSSSTAATFIQTANNMHCLIDGANADGKAGTLLGGGRYYRVIYARQSSSDGQISDHLYNAVTNLNVTLTALWHKDAVSAPVFGATAGYASLENVNITYTGVNATESNIATESCQMIGLGHSSFPNGVAFLNNVNVKSTSTNSIAVRAVVATESWRVFANNFKAEDVERAMGVMGSAGYGYINGATITSDNVVFEGAGKLSIYDAVITARTGALTTGSVMPTFHYGTGKTVIYTNGNVLSGNTVASGEYNLGPVAEGVYKLISSSDVHSITLPVVFSDGMMLQRNKVFNVYGYCDEIGATVRVDVDGTVVEATVGEDGRWKAPFEPMAAKTGVTISIDQLGKGLEGSPDVVIEDVNIGEIWVMSGQSNASLYSGWLEDVEELALLSETLNIREYTNNGYCLNPDPYGRGTWKDVTAAVVKETVTYGMSALGYATVARLSAELGPDVPVGLITIAQGSTKIMTWMDYEHLKELSPSLAEAYDGWVAQNTLPEKAHGSNAVGTVLYNRHVYPLEGFTTAGVLWYQGCGDIPGKNYFGTEGSTYTDFFTALEEIFRRAFGNGSDDLPFYVMQLAPYSRSGDGPSDGSYIYQFKLEQYEFTSKLKNTYLVPIANEGMAFTSNDIGGGAFIHPARKSPVGNRTADMILANEYGIKAKDVVTYPTPLSATVSADGVVTITFDTDIKLYYGDTPDGFELGDGTKWVKATGTVNGNKIILAASGLSTVTGVRYGSGRTQVELRDGTIIEVAHSKGQYTLSEDKKTYEVIDALTGNTYTIRVDSHDVVRTKNDGNITNASGIPLVLFEMTVTAE